MLGMCNTLYLQVSDADDCKVLGSELSALLRILHAEATTSTAPPLCAVVEPKGDQKPCVTMLNFDSATALGVCSCPVDLSPPSPMSAASLYTVVLRLGVDTEAGLCTLLIAGLTLGVRNEKHNHWAWGENRVARCPPSIQSAPVLRCYTQRPRVSAAGIISTRMALLAAALATTVGAALVPPSAPPPPPSPGGEELDGWHRFPHRTNLTAQVLLLAECNPSGNLPGRVGCVSVPRTLMVAHCSARFEHADCTLDTATGCVRLPHDSPNGGVLHGGGEVAFISSGAGLVPCTLGERPLGFNTCTESKAIAGSYSKSSVLRDPADPSTWAASGCTSCPSGKRADSATGAVCLPCVPGQFASNTGSASCDVCLAGSYSAGFESTSCTRCPTSGYCSSPGAGDEALAFTPCVQPPNTTIPHTTVALSHLSTAYFWQVP